MIGDPPSLAAFFSAWSANRGEFLHYDGDAGASRLTYQQTARGACAFAEKLRAAGIAQGERVIFWAENRPEWIVALWGCLLAGVVAVPIDFRSSSSIVERIASIVRARALLMADDLRAPDRISCPVWNLREAASGQTDASSVTPAPPDRIAEILFTSGATGDPKGVTITHRNILANLKPIDEGIAKYRKYMGPFKPIRFLNLLPLSHMFGQSMAALIPALIEGDVFFMPGYSPREVASEIRRRRISVLVCVPQMLDLLREFIVAGIPGAAEPARGGKWYRSWWQYRRVHRRFGWKFWSFVVGAAPLDPELEKFWRKLGYVVIQGYGLTETAPVATLNHPFETRAGTVGKPIGGVEIRIASDGEILLRGENVTPGYFTGDGGAATPEHDIRDPEGWLHTGDIGELDAEGRLRILGRKKEIILSPDGLNVFPEDVERALNAQPGVRESAVVAAKQGAREQVHAVLVLEPGADAEGIVGHANASLEAPQRVRAFSLWPGETLPRTSGTNKLRRGEVAKWVNGTAVAQGSSQAGTVEEILRRYNGGREVTGSSSLDALGLSSLDRIQLLMELEQRAGVSLDEEQLASAKTVADLVRAQPETAPASDDFEFPDWSRSRAARFVRRAALPGLVLPLARIFAWIRVEGVENIRALKGPVLFASNHQSHFDVPAIFRALPPRLRYRAAPAMSKEFFDAHFHPERHTFGQRFREGLMYYLSVLVFNAFPLPQREAGARDALRYAGDLASDGYSILIFPEGKRTDKGEIQAFQPGVGMLASRLHIPVVPVRVEGLERILHKDAKFATPGRARVKFGKPMRLEGDNYAALAGQIELAVRAL